MEVTGPHPPVFTVAEAGGLAQKSAKGGAARASSLEDKKGGFWMAVMLNAHLLRKRSPRAEETVAQTPCAAVPSPSRRSCS
jgi:hypothetical protein